MKIKNLILILFLCVATLNLKAEPIKVVKNVSDNPSVYFSGIASQPKLSNEIISILRASGWFDITNQKANASYELNGRIENTHLKLNLSVSGVPVTSWQIPLNANERSIAKTAVDAMLEKTFQQLNLKGFCNTRIAFCAETAKGIRNVYICDIDGKNLSQLTNFKTLCVEPNYTPGGRSVVYSRYNKAGIDVIETSLNPKRSRILTSLPGINTGAAVSPNGRTLAVILSPDHQVDLYTVPLGSKKFTRLTKSTSAESSPCWSPDGRQIAFVSGDGGRPKINIINIDGSNRRRLPSIGIEAVTPDWSADGKIAYATLTSKGYTIAVYDTKNGKNEIVTNLSGNWESPAWAPDNRHLICKRSLGKKSSLYVIDTYTRKARELFRTPYNLSSPSWSKISRI